MKYTKEQLSEIGTALQELSIARSQLSQTLSLLEKNFPKVKAEETAPAVQTINSLRRALRNIDRIVRTTPQRI